MGTWCYRYKTTDRCLCLKGWYSVYACRGSLFLCSMGAGQEPEHSRWAHMVYEIASAGTFIERPCMSAWAQSCTRETVGHLGWSWFTSGCLATQAKVISVCSRLVVCFRTWTCGSQMKNKQMHSNLMRVVSRNPSEFSCTVDGSSLPLPVQHSSIDCIIAKRQGSAITTLCIVCGGKTVPQSSCRQCTWMCLLSFHAGMSPQGHLSPWVSLGKLSLLPQVALDSF